MRLLDIFLNAWWIAVNITHNKKMEYLNNPTPEVIHSLTVYDRRLKRLCEWACERWGKDHVGSTIYNREHSE
jgi:hypothetical protein